MFILFCVDLVGVPGLEPGSRVPQTQVISATFTRPCSRLKPVRVPGVEPGSKGSKPLMLSVTPHPPEASGFVEKTPPGLEPREGYDSGLQRFECTLMGSISSAMPIPPTEFFHVHLIHLFLAANPYERGPLKMYRFIVRNLTHEIKNHLYWPFWIITRRVIKVK